jgi:hypothetical protein
MLVLRFKLVQITSTTIVHKDCNIKNCRFIREGDTTSVIGVLKKHHGCDIVDAPAGVVTTGCQPMRCMFPVLIEGLILTGNEDPDEAVYMV